MAIASITLVLLLISILLILIFSIIFPLDKTSLAQENVTQKATGLSQDTSFVTVIAAVSGGIVGAAASFFTTLLNNRHNKDVKQQEIKHESSIELLKYRIECYENAFKATELDSDEPLLMEDNMLLAQKLEHWYNEEKGAFLMSQTSLQMFRDLMVIVTKIMEEMRGPTSDERDSILKSVVLFRYSLQQDLGVRE